MDLASVTLETFTPHVGTTFEVQGAQGAPALELRAATAAPAPPGDRGRPPFSLLFVGPHEPVLEQAIHPLAHPALGVLEIFIVPVGRTADGVEYQAVFT